MKPALFDYHAPERVEDAVRLLADSELDARVLAGGQSLIPMMNFRIATPTTLVDLRRIATLRELTVDGHGTLVVGAGVTQDRVLRDARVRRGWPLLVEALRHVGHPQIRSRGTVCGSLAHHDPAAEPPAAALALDARIVAQGPGGRREIPAEDFFVSYYETALVLGEMVVEARFPARPVGEGHAFREVVRKQGDFALVGAGAVVSRTGHEVGDVRLVVVGVADHALRFPDIEQRLVGTSLEPELVAAVVGELAARIDPIDDNRASSEYRRDVAVALAVEAVTEAWRGTDG